MGAAHDVLPEEVRQQYSLAGWLEDMEEVHRPTTEASYQRACKGVALRVSRLTAWVCCFASGGWFVCEARKPPASDLARLEMAVKVWQLRSRLCYITRKWFVPHLPD